MKYLVKKTDDAYKVLYITDSSAFPRGGQHVFIESDVKLIAPVVEEVDGELILIEDPIKEKERLVTVAYDEMVTDVYDEMETAFGTRNDVSATAFAATFEAMLKRPENYVDEALGLSDAAAVTAYATAKINASDAYGVSRMKRIAQFETEKSTILGE